MLTRLFTYSPALQQAYAYREELTGLFAAPLSKEAALQQLTDWQLRVRASGLSCYDRFLHTLEKWKEEIANYFLARHNSGFVEGLNNKIKVLKRRCYGIFNLVISSNASFSTSKGTSATLTLQDETTMCGISHGNIREPKFFSSSRAR